LQSHNSSGVSSHPLYAGIFIVSFTILALEVALTRLLSVLTWYHLAFFAVSTALLGMTIGSVTVYLYPDWFTRERLPESLSKVSLAGGLIIPICLILLLQIPIQMTVISLVTATVLCTLPYYFLGTVIAAILTKSDLPIGKIYASDLAGAALGCLLVLGGLEIFSAPGIILLCGACASLASISFAWHLNSGKLRTIGVWWLWIIVILFGLCSVPVNRLRPVTVKGKFENSDMILLEKWNSYSRVTVSRPVETEPFYWSPSPLRPQDFRTIQFQLKIDGDAGTTIRRFSSLADIDHLRFEGTNLVHYLRPKGTACIIGFGGGKDILGAILFGHEQIVGIEVNRIFIDLLNNQFRDFAGIADYPGVVMVGDEARSYLSRNDINCSVIQMSLIDTWAATGAGAFSLSENSLYTVEAWEVFLDRLTEDGVLTVSRWYDPDNLGETGRLASLAVKTLLDSGVSDPSRHMAMVTVNAIATLLVSKAPFNQEDIQMLKQVSRDLQYDLVLVPGTPPENPILRGIVSAKSYRKLDEFIGKQEYNLEPPTDESPYFFNLLRLKNLSQANVPSQGIIQGNLLATATLVKLIFSLAGMTLAAIVLPLWLKTRMQRNLGTQTRILRLAGGMYFSLIGAGFMLVEIALIQRFSVFLGHPIYSLGILLFTLIASTSLGSYVSERLPLERRPWMLSLPFTIAGLILLMSILIRIVLPALTPASMFVKIVFSITFIAPLGFHMGFFFPMGMRLVKAVDEGDTPWYWALNGIFGVLFSALAVFISIYSAISNNFYLASLFYAALILPIILLAQQRGFRSQLSDAGQIVVPKVK
jgi:hypothetical protein